MPIETLYWGIEYIVQLQENASPLLINLMKFFTFVGNEEGYLVLLPFIYWCIDGTLGLRLLVFMSTAHTFLLSLKLGFNDPRPYWLDARVKLLISSDGLFGIPSGHANHAVVIWGTIAAAIKKWWSWAVVLFIIFMIGISRIYLGVHFPTDVFAGWALGLLMLILFYRLERPFVNWLKKYSFGRKVFRVFLISLLMILGSKIVINLVDANFELPAEWASQALASGAEEAISPLEIAPFVTSAAIIFGAVTGYLWINKNGGMDSGGVWPKRILRYLVGIVAAVAIWAGLDALFAIIATDESLLGMVLRYLRYSLLGFWIAGIAPWAFIRLGWAQPK